MWAKRISCESVAPDLMPAIRSTTINFSIIQETTFPTDAQGRPTGVGCQEDREVGVQVSPGTDFAHVVFMYNDSRGHPTYKPLFDACKAHWRAMKEAATRSGRVFLETPHMVMGTKTYGSWAGVQSRVECWQQISVIQVPSVQAVDET